ncbi:F-box domain protein [Talaromyces stipitatus ATCC 10500]|uniref:F-box domain protein n=1 Tax=Talaromyces stipitatus (strain ATCC 10500 / CBS 375.48 / QM 6759 / NRRL 1006) TaxID=441959 RepID=B8MFS0_TALSN|nr:F-box domain protein [Talaromyces stipitatus ATCC 10500]EED17060.1 F-box domain protein [Talaromyces stipitatus ATCC 10500]
MSDDFSKLPAEIIFMILSHLPVAALVSFGTTSKSNYTFHTHCMRKLHLAIFHKRIHGSVAFLSTGMQDNIKDAGTARRRMVIEDHKIPVVLPRDTRYMSPDVCKSTLRTSNPYSTTKPYHLSKHISKKRCRVIYPDDGGFVHSISPERTINAQNKLFAEIVSRYGHSFDELEFLTYDINEEGAMAIGTHCGSRLRHLALRFEHPYVNDSSLRHRYWQKSAPGSPAWNSLIGIGAVKRGLDIVNLESLILERAGITPWQLRMLVMRNKRLKVLKLKNCAAAQPEFVDWLGGISITEGKEPQDDDKEVPGASLKVLWMENCNGICTGKTSDRERGRTIDVGLEWIRNLKALESLSLRDCRNVDAQVVSDANTLIWRIREVHLPRALDLDPESPPPIEVDPLYA